MKALRPLRPLIAVLILSVLLSACKLATIRPLDPKTGKAIISTEDVAFNAERYVAERWEDPLMRTMIENAVELPDLLKALTEDSAAASERYGNQQGNSPYSFMVKGEGKVLELDTTSRAGLLKLDLAPFDGQADISLAVGLGDQRYGFKRCHTPLFKFNDFTNQLEFADVSKALHARVMSQVLESFEAEASVGKLLSFLGVSTLTEPIVITPVQLELKQ
ncbi:MAG: DUF2291 domain-containing protein [Deinococcales bacterium]